MPPEITAHTDSQPAVNIFASRRRTWQFLAAVFLFVLIVNLTPTDIWGIKITLAIVISGIFLWTTAVFPLSFTSFLIIISLIVFGAVPREVAVSGFSSASIMLSVGGFIMARGVNQTTLGQRLAYFLLSKFGRTPGGTLMAILLTLQVMAFIVPSVAVRTMLLLPMIMTIIDSIDSEPGPTNIKKILLLGLAIGTLVTGLGVLTGTIANVILIDILSTQLGTRITYFDWLINTMPISLALIPVTCAVILHAYPVKNYRIPAGSFVKHLRALGRLTIAEKKCLFILLLTVALWSTERLHGWHPSVPALIAAILMGFPGLGFAQWSELLSINWETVLIVGTTLSIGAVLNYSGAAAFIAETLVPAQALQPLLATTIPAIIVITLFTKLYHLLVGNVTTVVITLVPIIINIALYSGRDPVAFSLATTIAALTGFILVVQTMPNIIVAQTNFVTQRDFLRTGIPIGLATIAVLLLAAAFWWPLMIS